SRRGALVALQVALLPRGRQVGRGVAAEPAVARPGARLSAPWHGTQAPHATPVAFDPPGGRTRDGVPHLLLDQLDDCAAQIVREAIDERAKRSIPLSLGHDCCVLLRWRNGAAGYVPGGAAKRNPTGTLVVSFTRPPVNCCTVAGVSDTVPGISRLPSRRTPPEKLMSACGVASFTGAFNRAQPSFTVKPKGRSFPRSVSPPFGMVPRSAPGSAPTTGAAADAMMSFP